MSDINRDKYQYGPKSFGMSARTSFFDGGDIQIPGPGKYNNIRLNESNPPQWRIGNDTQRNSFLQKYHFQYPPPNNYNPKFQTTRTNFPNYSIPQANQSHLEKHIDQNNSLLYKPNFYSGKDTSPQYSLGYFQQIDYRTCTPSPNHYHRESNKQFFNKTQNTFSSSNRPNPYGQNARFPGTGAYYLQNYKNPIIQYSIGSGQRPNIVIGPDAPGTFYQIAGDLSKSNTGKRFGAQFPLPNSKNDDFPAPTKYTPLQLKSNKKIITTYANRSPLQNKAILKYPSPQKYNTQTDFYKRRSYSFTKDIKDRSYIINNPGPGTHQVFSQFNTTSGIMGKKLKNPQKLITPGADHYSPKKQYVAQSSPRVINFYSSRVDFSKSLTGKQVGPGSYRLEKQTRAQLGKMSKSMKFGKQPNKNPGPGSYYIPSSIGKLPKYYSGTKKVTNQGFSTFTLEQWERQKRHQQRLYQLQRRKQQQQQELQIRNNSSQINNNQSSTIQQSQQIVQHSQEI